MVVISDRLSTDTARFRDRILYDSSNGVLDPENRHHEFVTPRHGRKLDFDKIPDGSDIFVDWIAIYARTLMARYQGRMPDALVGIANGANRLSTHIAPLLGRAVLPLTTEKDPVDPKKVNLDERSLQLLRENDVRFALTVEDVGTTGSTTSSAIVDLRKAGVRRVESINGWQRSPNLGVLEDMRVPHQAVVMHPLPTFTVEECETLQEGYCFQGVELIPHGQ